MSSCVLSWLITSSCSFPHGKEVNPGWIFHFSLLALWEPYVASGAAATGMASGHVCQCLSRTLGYLHLGERNEVTRTELHRNVGLPTRLKSVF